MDLEIGSIYEMNPAFAGMEAGDGKAAAAVGDCGHTLALAEVKKYGKEHCVYTGSCREAIALALRSLERRPEKTARRCLLPAYMCDTVFLPFVRAGWEIFFYHVDKKLQPEIGELRRLMEEVRPGLAFIHSYYGVDTWKAARGLIAKWKRQGVCIMEDVTQSYYLEGVGTEADYVVGSLRKWYPVPDGGFMASREEIPADWLEEPADYIPVRIEALTEKWAYLKERTPMEEKKERKAGFLKRNREAEERLEQYTGISRISQVAARILRDVDEGEAKARRGRNYRYLYEKLCGKTQFTPMLDGAESGQGAAPLYFAVYVRERDRLQAFLTAHDIYAPVLWPIGNENKGLLTAEEAYIYGHMLALPIDQRYGLAQMERIADVMEEYERQTNGADGVGRPAVGGQLIGIRADANEIIATGHIMRCITIAKQLKRMGNRVIFFTADAYGSEWLAQAGMETICLHSEWNHMERELPRLREELKRTGCRKLLVDSYQANAQYFEKLRDLCRLVYIDDCFDGVYPVDLLINYNAYYVRFPYEKVYKEGTTLLLGTAYAPLREEFGRRIPVEGYDLHKPQAGQEAQAPHRILPEPEAAGEQGGKRLPPVQAQKEARKALAGKQTLLSAGGGDQSNALLGILEEAVKDRELQDVIFHTVVGKFHKSREKMERLAAAYPNIRLHENVTDMAGLMEKCSAAVSAAGTMLFELSAMGVPAVFFVSADNQQYDSEFFAKEERMLFAGDIRTNREKCIGEICRGIKKILLDEELQKRMKAALQKVTDGKGAQRIAQAVAEL